jgi:hypothetical protein
VKSEPDAWQKHLSPRRLRFTLENPVGTLLPAFLEWFFPNIAADIDWTRGHEFLDKELQRIARRAKEKRRYADKLAKVWRRDGTETWVLMHVEIQAGYEAEFAERMFVYYYRLVRPLPPAAGQSGGVGR